MTPVREAGKSTVPTDKPANGGLRSPKASEREPELHLTPNALRVLEKRYLKKDDSGRPVERPEDMFHRVAYNVASADAIYDPGADVEGLAAQFYRLMAKIEFLPNSPTLMNAGRELQQLSACFVLPVEDSMESIFEAVKAAAIVHKSGGGTGLSFSRLRPKNDIVRTTKGIASGPVSFMRVFDAATEAVKQGGTRRGANMGILNVDHPDILEFVTCKQEGNGLQNFNISVALTEEFMQAVEADEDYSLRNPRTGEAVGRMDAREVFRLIVEGAWKNGDPGIVFIDRINRDNPTPHVGRIESTNPCVVGSALVPTEWGLMRMEEIARRWAKGGLRVLTDNRVASGGMVVREATTGGFVMETAAPGTVGGVSLGRILRAFPSGVKETVRVTTASGFELLVTPDHEIMTTEGWIPAGELEPGVHRVLVQSGAGSFRRDARLPFAPQNEVIGANGRSYRFNLPDSWSEDLGFVLGWLVGDGWLRSGDKNCRLGFTFSKADEEALDLIKGIVNRWYGRDIREVRRENGVYHLSYHSKYLVDFFERLGVRPGRSEEKRIPESLFTAPREAVVAFLRGLFTADGTANYRTGQSSYVRLTAKSRPLLSDVQLLLLNLGIRSRIYDRSRAPRQGVFAYRTVSGEERTYRTDGVLYELEISREPVMRFLRTIGFLGDRHAEKIRQFHGKEYYSVRFDDEVKAVEPAGGHPVFDLTEPGTHSFVANGLIVANCGEQPLLPYESCNLGSINLSKFVVHPGDGVAIDYDRLREVVHVAAHFLDNVIDVNQYPVSEIGKATRSNRKIGLGVMGWADMLVKLGVPYDSEEAVALAEKVMAFIQEESKKASAKLAERRGVFPNYAGSIYDVPGGLRLRNATTTTIAPTGTLSIIAGCSSGIEPLFALSYFRKVLDNEKLVEVNPVFEEIAKGESFYSEELMRQVAEKGGVAEVESVPPRFRRLFVTAHDVEPLWHIRMQAAFQKYVDNAVSKTVNFSHEATPEDVEEVFFLAYRLGCKGVTIYRDRSREEQVLNLGTAEAKAASPEAPPLQVGVIRPRPRPKTMRGITTEIKTGCGSLYVTINEDEKGRTFEVFSNMGKAGGCEASQTEATSRLISQALRSGIDPQTIVKQLIGIRCNKPYGVGRQRVLSCSDAIAKVVMAYLEETEQKKADVAGLRVIEGAAGELTMDVSDVAVGSETDLEAKTNFPCPDCGCELEISEGCEKCNFCGYSECS